MNRLSNSFLSLTVLSLTTLLFFWPQPDERAVYRSNSHQYKSRKLAMRGAVKEPNDWFMRQRTWPSEEFNIEAMQEGFRQSKLMHQSSGSQLNETWELAGPSNIGGRVTALAVHPDNPGIIYAGAAFGGVFKSIDDGQNFFPVFEEDFALSIGAMASDPQNPETIWLGTGEANSSGDSYPGNGVYVTRNGGDTWEHKGLENSFHIAQMEVDPTDSNRVFVAVMGGLYNRNDERGVYRTINGGDSWENVFFLNDSTGCIDVEVNPLNPDTIYAVMWERVRSAEVRNVAGYGSGIWRSYDGGDNWEELTNGTPQDEFLGRGSLAIAPSDPSVLYLFYSNHPGYFHSAYKSTDYGDTWTTIDPDNGIESNLYSSFGWYFGEIKVSPVNPDHVYVMGVYMYKSTDGGEFWDYVFLDSHVDHHAMWINPNNPNHVISGHDGGVNISYNGGMTTDMHTYLPNTQFYAINHHPANTENLYGGTQDNGTIRTTTGSINDWHEIYGGDGFYVQIDPVDSQIMYACYQWGGLSRSDNGGEWFESINYYFEDDRTNWMTPYQIDPNNHESLFLGTYRIWQSDNYGNSWSPISPNLTDTPEDDENRRYHTITTLSVSPIEEGVIYAGTDDGNVWVTTNGGTLWERIDETLPERWVTRVTADPREEGVVYVALSGYHDFSPLSHLYRSEDYGQTWVSISDGLPEQPINDIVVDPWDSDRLYVATDWGVFYSLNLGVTWETLGEGLPSVSIFDLDFINFERILVAGTHGRSMYKYDLGPYSGAGEAPESILPENLIVNAYPNPFNAEANINVNLPSSGHLKVEVYNLLGRRVAQLVDGHAEAGWQKLHWDGSGVSSSTYIVRAITDTEHVSKRITLVK